MNAIVLLHKISDVLANEAVSVEKGIGTALVESNDYDTYHRMFSDPGVMKYLTTKLTPVKPTNSCWL